MSSADRVRKRREAYRRTFYGPGEAPHADAAEVLKDLRRFCHINSAALVVSPVTKETDVPATMVALGRREVFMRIAAHIGLDEAELDVQASDSTADAT